MTHAELVKRAARWLKTTVGCQVVFAEFVTAPETPDAIGWKYGHLSVLVECKATRADFLADRKKFFRRVPEYGMGDRRYFMCPPELIRADELPEGWGLLYAERRIEVVRFSWAPGVEKPKYGNPHWAGPNPFQSNKRREIQILTSALRRCALRWDLSEIQKPLVEGEWKN